MKIILAGIEYVGTTTMASSLRAWKNEVMGEPFNNGLIHDHFKLPHTSGHPDDTTPEEQQQILNLSPKLKEMYHRYSIYYHLHHYAQADELTIGLHIEEAIYARRYFGYGGGGDVGVREADRQVGHRSQDSRRHQHGHGGRDTGGDSGDDGASFH